MVAAVAVCGSLKSRDMVAAVAVCGSLKSRDLFLAEARVSLRYVTWENYCP